MNSPEKKFSPPNENLIAPEKSENKSETVINLGKQALDGLEKIPLSERFQVDPADYPIFSRQAGVRDSIFTGRPEMQTLNINETLSLMVGCTATAISKITGENNTPAADHVIYLDKSARPVSWLVDEFWEEFTDKKKPQTTYLAIDRRPWFERAGLELVGHEEIRDPSGELRPATADDFWRAYKENVSEEKRREHLARIRALYIPGGIEDENIDKILSTPTILDGKNLLIVDEVSRTGATLGIATGLLKLAIPELSSVNGCVFWGDNSTQISSGYTQMGAAPVWYPRDSKDWRGRGVKDINPEFYERQYLNDPNNKTRAEKFGSFVLGEPLERREDEPGELSWKLREEIEKMHLDYKSGRILPNLGATYGDVQDRIIDKFEKLGVEFLPSDQIKGRPNAYQNLMKKIRQQKASQI